VNRKQSNFCGNFPVTDGEGKPLKVMVGLGCMAEFCVVSRANLIKLRPEMPLAKAALVGCATVTGYGTRRADQRDVVILRHSYSSYIYTSQITVTPFYNVLQVVGRNAYIGTVPVDVSAISVYVFRCVHERDSSNLTCVPSLRLPGTAL
jgi:hypothetical protein